MYSIVCLTTSKFMRGSPPKKVDFTVLPLPFGTADKQVDGPFRDVEAHELPLMRVVVALRREAVFAAQVAVVRNMQA